MNWEMIKDGHLRRARTPWGWLVETKRDVIPALTERAQDIVSKWDHRISITFVFDPFHWWR